jgi:competence protein ComGC
MKMFTLIAVILLLIISVFVWLLIPSSTSSSDRLETSSVNTIMSVTDEGLRTNYNQKATVKISAPKIETPLIANNKGANINDKVEIKVLKEGEALQIAETLLSHIYNNQAVDFSVEKSLLNYLKETNNEQVYQFIIEKLQAANIGNENDDRLIEYSLSLLAAVDSSRASEIFFDFVAKDNWQGSHAIYTVRKSIEKLNRNGNYTDLAQQTFTQSKDDNPFIGELAESIAHHANVEQVDYLISYIDGESKNKSTIVSGAMNKIQTESLVPHITSYLSGSSTMNVQNTVLNTLANMGQYEAASALLVWSSKQRKDSAEQIEQLFNVAVRRSPSTKRAIEKELVFLEFTSEELKELIINISKKGL